MSDENCQHSWGEVEEVESLMGIIYSPICRHCGAVKLEVGRQAAERRRVDAVAKHSVLQAAQQRGVA